MSATAYASLVSLLNTLDLIHTHPRLTTTLDHFQNESLRQMVHFFVDFLEKYSVAESREAEDLVRRMADVAREAEDLIEVHAADRIRAGSTTKSLTVVLGLQRIIQEMNLIKETVSKLKVEEGAGFITQSSSSSAPPATAKTTTMVGFDAHLKQLLDQLIGLQSCRRIIPIVGMGGIGKTTLARNVYQNSLILHHFDVHAWVTVSQEFNATEILLQALSCLGGSTSKMDGRTDEGNKVMSILYLSYKHLPICLKPCFLHLGLFPEDHKIYMSKLIKLWVAEGFIKPNREQSLEEIAESYIKNLVDRNLLLLDDHLYEHGTCFVHDLVRESCIRIGLKGKFYRVQRGIDGRRHFIVDQTTAMALHPRDSHRPSILRPLILEGQRVATPFKSRLLRVLFSKSDYVDHIQLDSNFREVNSRFLFHQSSGSDIYILPSSISLLWCLQTLIISCSYGTFVAPAEIWKMPQLRHIDITAIYLPDPPPSGGEQEDVIVLHNLQTLKTVYNLIFTEEVCKRIPNIKELDIKYSTAERGGASSCYDLHNVSCFNKLVSLSYSSNCPDIFREFANVKLPSSLKELFLWDCGLEWSYMTMIASLPHLQILELGRGAFIGAEWNMSAEEEILRLKHLKISECEDLIYWIADRSNFPVLETLVLRNLSKVKEIPSGIGEISTLERIEMDGCRESASISAVGILEIKQSLGNYDLRLDLFFTHPSKSQMLTKKIKQLDSTCHKLCIGRCGKKYTYHYKETY